LEQLQTLQAIRQPRKIAGWRMTFRTAARTIEVLLAGLSVAGLEISDIDGPTVTLVRVGLRFCVVDERDDGGEVCVWKILRRHAFVDPAGVNERDNLVAAHVLGDETRAREIGACLAAHRVATVTKPAACDKQRLAALNQIRRIRLHRDRLRRLLRRRALLPTSSLTASSTGRSRRLRSLGPSDDDDKEREQQRGRASRRDSELRECRSHKVVW
jgi:hypothetical protein